MAKRASEGDSSDGAASRVLSLPLPGLEGGIGKRTVKEQISDKIAYMICSGLLQIGDELPSERELAVTLNVSRETVRSAIQTLAGRGMVEISQGARTRVVRNDGYPLHEAVGALRALKNYDEQVVSDARKVLEVAVLRDAAVHISEPDLNRLEGLVQRQAEMLDDPVRFQISDREFHEIIYRACSNPLLSQYVTDLYGYALDFRRAALQVPGTVQRSYHDHKAIVAALRTHDPDAAEAAIGSHLDNIHTTTVKAMERKRRR